MTFSHDETKDLIEFVLNASAAEARDALHERLVELKRSEPEFCAGVMAHGRGMPFTSEQWAEFLLKVPNSLFGDENWLMSKLSENQRQRLKF